MATYSEVQQLMRQLRPIVERLIEQQPNVKSAIKAKKAVVQALPDTEKHTVAIKFLPDLFDRDIEPMTFPYNPCLTASDLEVGKAVFVFYSQSLSNGVVMQNETWTAGGAGGTEGGAVLSVNGQTGDVILDADDLKAVSYEQQTLSDEQKGQARENIDAGQTTFLVEHGETEGVVPELRFEVTKKSTLPSADTVNIASYREKSSRPVVKMSIPSKESGSSPKKVTLKII